jgi:hypothetical protein
VVTCRQAAIRRPFKRLPLLEFLPDSGRHGHPLAGEVDLQQSLLG